MSGVGAAIGLAASALQFLAAAKSCLSILQEIKQNTPESLRTQRFRLESQVMKFGEWCSVLGVQDMASISNQNASDTPEFKQFQHHLHTLVRFDNEQSAKLVTQALQDMETTIQKARARLISDTSDLPSTSSRRNSTIGRIFRFRKGSGPDIPLAPVARRPSGSSSAPNSTSPGLVATVKWLAYDKGMFEQLIIDLEAKNEYLETFMSTNTSKQIDRRVQASTLTNLALDPRSPRELLPEHSEIVRLAKVQQAVREEEKCQEDSIVGQNGNGSTSKTQEIITTRPLMIHMTEFEPGTLDIGNARSLSFLNGPVLVEWTHYGKSIQLDQFYRRGHLISLLNDGALFQKFMALQPRGLVVDSEHFRIGLVFEVPTLLRPAPQEMTLHDMIQTSQRSLGQKFGMAKALSNVMWNLLLVNWLHKSIRSDNIVYFREADQVDEVEENNQQPESVSLRLPAAMTTPPPELYLLGWNLSRPDHDSEISETMSISMQDYKLAKELVQLSSHPDLLHNSPSSTRARYKAEYDIYSFGLVLLEIGLWKPLSFLRGRCDSDDTFQRRVAREYCDQLLPLMGETYWRVTKRCICNAFDRKFPTGLTMGDGDEMEDQPLSIVFERQVVSELENCSV